MTMPTLEAMDALIKELDQLPPAPHSLLVGTGVWEALQTLSFDGEANYVLGTPVKHAPWLERDSVVPLDAGGNPIERPKL